MQIAKQLLFLLYIFVKNIETISFSLMLSISIQNVGKKLRFHLIRITVEELSIDTEWVRSKHMVSSLVQLKTICFYFFNHPVCRRDVPDPDSVKYIAAPAPGRIQHELKHFFSHIALTTCSFELLQS